MEGLSKYFAGLISGITCSSFLTFISASPTLFTSYFAGINV